MFYGCNQDKTNKIKSQIKLCSLFHCFPLLQAFLIAIFFLSHALLLCLRCRSSLKNAKQLKRPRINTRKQNLKSYGECHVSALLQSIQHVSQISAPHFSNHLGLNPPAGPLSAVCEMESDTERERCSVL